MICPNSIIFFELVLTTAGKFLDHLPNLRPAVYLYRFQWGNDPPKPLHPVHPKPPAPPAINNMRRKRSNCFSEMPYVRHTMALRAHQEISVANWQDRSEHAYHWCRVYTHHASRRLRQSRGSKLVYRTYWILS